MDLLGIVSLALLIGSFLLILAAAAVWFGAAMISVIWTIAVALILGAFAAMIGYVLRPDRKARG